MPLLVLDDTFHVRAHFLPPSFSDEVFRNAVRCGEITYEAGAVISKSPALSGGTADYIKLVDSVYPRRFAPLISAGVRLGYLVCVDTDGHLREIPDDVWLIVSRILAKQLFVETSRQDRPFETAQDILMHLLDGGFQSAPYFWLQAAGTYLADFHPSAFALIDLTAYHNLYLGKRHLKDEVNTRFPDSHSFLYRGDVFLFLHGDGEKSVFADVVKEFQLKVVISEGLGDLFSLPALYRTAHEALELMRDERFHSGNICTVAQLRTPLLLKNLELRGDLISRDVQRLAAHDRERNTQYCETLYHYLTCSRSLKRPAMPFYPPEHRALSYPPYAGGISTSLGRAIRPCRFAAECVAGPVPAERTGFLPLHRRRGRSPRAGEINNKATAGVKPQRFTPAVFMCSAVAIVRAGLR